MDMFACVCVCLWIFVWGRDWKYVLNDLLNAKWIQYWNNVFFLLRIRELLVWKLGRSGRKTVLWNTFSHNNEPRADIEQWKHNQPRLHSFFFSVTKLLCRNPDKGQLNQTWTKPNTRVNCRNMFNSGMKHWEPFFRVFFSYQSVGRIFFKVFFFFCI